MTPSAAALRLRTPMPPSCTRALPNQTATLHLRTATFRRLNREFTPSSTA